VGTPTGGKQKGHLLEGKPARVSFRLFAVWARPWYSTGEVVTSLAASGDSEGQVLAQETFPPQPESLAPIRAFVQRWAGEVGLKEEQAQGLKLAVSEACANAMDHPEKQGDITLGARRHPDRFTVDVSHPGEFRVKGSQDRGHRGLGLPLMVALADEVSFACLPQGGTRVSLSVFLKERKVYG
jgi:anti-sigma regulatory factor (Ser/Thr protein kinase)